MVAFGRTIAAFLLLVVIGYLAMVALLPAPDTSDWRPNEMTGQSAAARLSQEARGLVGRRPATSLQ